MPLFIVKVRQYTDAYMNELLQNIDFTKLNLESDVQQLIEQLLNHIEILVTETRELKEENQCLRDEIARIKGGKGKPDIKANT